MEFSRPEYWSEYLFTSPGDLPNPGIESRSSAFQADSLPAEQLGKPKNTGVGSLSLLQQIFPTQDSNRGLLHCRQILNASPPLINSILPSFCLVSDNSFPICAQIMTVGRGEKEGKSSKERKRKLEKD